MKPCPLSLDVFEKASDAFFPPILLSLSISKRCGQIGHIAEGLERC